jgi:hypothetical protein
MDPKDIGMLLLGTFKAVIQIIILPGEAAQKLGGHIDNNPFVGGSIQHTGAVYLSCVHQHNIIGLQLIILPLNGIDGITTEKNHNFIKIMIMKSKLLSLPVNQMKHLKIMV